MSVLGWVLGLAAYDALTNAEDKSEEAWREADALWRANETNERRIRRLEDELRALKRERGSRSRYS